MGLYIRYNFFYPDRQEVVDDDKEYGADDSFGRVVRQCFILSIEQLGWYYRNGRNSTESFLAILYFVFCTCYFYYFICCFFFVGFTTFGVFVFTILGIYFCFWASSS